VTVYDKRRELAGDLAVAQWIQEHTHPEDVVLEATAHAYEWSPRLATLTGRPTVIGWRNHEAGWRNSWVEPNRRTEVVDEIYSTADLEEALILSREWGVKFLYVGRIEQRQYGRAVQKFKDLPVAFASAGSTLYRIAPEQPSDR
jgi:uncharacterized membrane protein